MKVDIDDKTFECVITYDQIKKRARLLGIQLSVTYEKRHPVFIGILNGSFMFMGDLMKKITVPAEVTFVKYSSYKGGQRQETIEQLLGLDVDLHNRDVIIVEDIVDTGHTLKKVLNLIHEQDPASVSVCTLLLKPTALQQVFDNIAYVGFEIANDFVVGYGLDYNGMGRNLPDIYKEI